MVAGKRMLCRKCCVTYDNKYIVKQIDIATGIPVPMEVKRRSCPECGGILTELKRKR